MIEQAIEKIRNMTKPDITKVENTTYIGKEILHQSKAWMGSFTINTLTGLVDYINSDIDGLNDQKIKLMVVVKNFNNVYLVSGTDTDLQKRHNIIDVDSHDCEFEFNRKMDIESFIIGLQANFQGTEDAATILKFVSSLTSSAVLEVNDTGSSQDLKIKSGVRSENADVPNPVMLKPWRTFTEVEQPPSRFIFRVGKNSNDVPVCGLYAADGGAWKNEAIINIRDFLKKNLPDDVTIIA